MNRTAVVLVLLLPTLLSGCEKPLSNVALGNQTGVLHIANGDEPQTLDPQKAAGSNDFNIIYALFEGLIDLHPQTLEVIPASAQSWTVSDNGRVYTFLLRANARWSNGEPVQAKDFVYAWQRALSPSLASVNAYQLFAIKNARAYHKGAIDDFSRVGVKALSTRQLEVELEYGESYFLQALSHPVFYPLHRPSVHRHGELRWAQPGTLIGNGAFTLADWQLNRHIEVIANAHYWDSKTVQLNAIRFYPIDNKQAEERAFRSGQVHLTNTPQLAIDKLAEYQRNQAEVLQQAPVYASYYYTINTSRAPFSDKRVRRALSLAVDRQRLVERVTRGGEVAAVSFVPADEYWFSAQNTLGFNPGRARELLAEAGFANGEGFPVFELLFNTGEVHRKVAQAVQYMWRENLGIHTELRNMEWKTFIAAQNSQQYTVSRAGWIADFLHPVNFFEPLTSTSGNNDTLWGNKEYDSLIKQAGAATSHAELAPLLQRANTILLDEMPVIPLFHPSDNNLVRREVKNWFPNLLHRHPYKWVYLEGDSTQGVVE